MPDAAHPSSTSPAEVPGGSPSDLRRANSERVLAALTSGGPATQSDLARTTGLSPATISNLVRVLRRAGRLTTSPTTANGRRAVLVSPSAPDRLALGLDVGRRHVRCIVITADGSVQAEEHRDLSADATAAECLAASRSIVDEVLAAADAGRADVSGAAVGMVAPLDRRSGQVGHAALLPGFEGADLASVFREALDLPVLVENDANLGAIGEHRWGGHGTGPLLYVKVGTGIGAGLVLDGGLYRGNIGMAGEIGHLSAGPYGEVCRCGNRGCIETVASIPAMLGALGAPLGRQVRTSELMALVGAGDVAALRVLEDAALVLGRILGGVCSILDPATVVIGGPLHRAGPAFLEPLQHGIRRATNPSVGAAVRVTLSALGDRSEALGAATLALTVG